MNSGMKERTLEAPLVIKNFVKGEANSNYEIYLREVLNNSQWFSTNHPGIFVAPERESQGECDASNSVYQIDFKLFASKTELQAKSLFSSQISKMTHGMIAWSASKCQGGIDATRLHVAFRGKGLDDLLLIEKSKNKQYGVDNDVKTALMNLRVKKNLLLYLPIEFSFEESLEQNTATEYIAEGLTNDFKAAFEYRSLRAYSYDTFMTCICAAHFVLMEIKHSQVHVIELIPTEQISTFSQLKEQYVDRW